MKIQLINGMNIPGKDGNVIPASAGDVVEVPERFGRQQIAALRAVVFVEDVEIEKQEGEVTSKLSKR